MSALARVSGPTRALPALKAAYALARRAGWLDRRWFRRLYVSAYFAYKRHVEDPFDALLRRRPELVRGGSVADVGAHVGYTASVFCEALDPGFRVYAFEADPANVRLLLETLVSQIALGRVVAVEAAVGSGAGTAELLRSAVHPGDHRIGTPAFQAQGVRDAVQVSVVSLDEFFASRPDEPLAFVKVDVQGYEIEVCRGMARTLERCPSAAVAVEYAPDEAKAMGFDPADIERYFRARGYSLHLLRRDGVLEGWHAGQVAALVARRGYVDLLCLRGAGAEASAVH